MRDGTAYAAYFPTELQAKNCRSCPPLGKRLRPLHKTGHAVGLRVDLPDLTDKGETAALCRLPSDTWKDPFEGEVSDTMRNGGHNWLRLADYPFATAFFDLEEGIKFRTAVAELADCLAFIVSLASKGARLWDREYMEGHGGESGSCVWVTQAIMGPVPDAATMFAQMGLVPRGPDGLPPWTLPPGWEAPRARSS